MFHFFSSLRGLLKIDSSPIDNNVFKLHYRWTVIILVSFSLIVTSHQYIGDPIDCICDEIPSHIMDTYCWIHSTFTLPTPNEGLAGQDMVSPSVSGQIADNGETKYHKYYQWMCFALFFQAVLFYIPRYLWKTWEAGRLNSLLFILSHVNISEEKNLVCLDEVVGYFLQNLHRHNFYVFRFIVCELLNFVNVMVQIYFMDYFLDGEFRSYGMQVLNLIEMDSEERVDRMTSVFPKVTKCTFRKYGPSGSIQKFDGICLLSINFVIEKIYILLWFSFVLLGLITGVWLIFQTIVMSCRPLRLYLLQAQTRYGYSSRKEIETIANKFELGDWFIFYQLGKNIHPIVYEELISLLAEEIAS